ncbi:MAG: hypothetical protein LBM20_07860 [Rikenellaceae bacterium]|jgi:uncharacterized protein (TIGR02145 family)|nr:hypothetical protein [Rikenellaceae bacterium]
MKKFLFLTLAGLLVLGASSCEKQVAKSKKGIIMKSGQIDQTVYADEEKGSSTVLFTTAGAWTSSISEEAGDWVSISPSSGDGAGDYTIAITLEPNFTGIDRSATILITSDDGSIPITVTQKAVIETGEKPVNPYTYGTLINGITWANTNVDTPRTFAVNPEDFGMFYQWGKKVGWSATGSILSTDGNTTWDESIVSGNAWESANDPCPAGWQVPNVDDFRALADGDKVVSTGTMQSGVSGMLFVDKATKNSIFLPAVGSRDYPYGSFKNQGTFGYYWSSTVYNGTNGYYLSFFDSEINPSRSINYNRGNGLSVRCVYK